MKRFLFILIVVLLLTASTVTLADAPQWVALDPIGSSVETFGANLKTAGTFKTEPRPFSLKPLPDKNGYVLLYLGSETMFGATKKPGGIVYLDAGLKPTSKKISFSGLVVSEFFQKDSNTWFVFTAEDPKSKDTNNTLNIVQLQNGTVKTVSLNSTPSFFKIKDGSKLAVATAGNSEAKIKPELYLIDLATLACDTYPLTLNPGAIFFIDNDQLLVACGGYRNSQVNLLGIFNDSSDTASEPATLHLVNSRLKTVKTIRAGFSPLAIIQDHSKSDVFYLGSTAESNSSDPSGIVQVLTGDTITATIKLDAQPVFLAQAGTGNLCVLSHDQFFLIDPANSKTITKLQYNLKIDALRLSHDGKTGYLTNVNSNYMDVINLADGSRQAKLQIGKPSILGSFSLDKLLPSTYPPVIGMQERLQRNPESASTNYRMFLAPDSETMYVLSSNSEIKALDLKTNTFKSTTKFKGSPYGMNPTPNSKFIVVPTPNDWNLIDPNRNKPILTVFITNEENKSAPATGYYSPDGSLLIVPFEKTLFVIDTVNGKFLGKVRSKIENPIIVWP